MDRRTIRQHSTSISLFYGTVTQLYKLAKCHTNIWPRFALTFAAKCKHAWTVRARLFIFTCTMLFLRPNQHKWTQSYYY